MVGLLLALCLIFLILQSPSDRNKDVSVKRARVGFYILVFVADSRTAQLQGLVVGRKTELQAGLRGRPGRLLGHWGWRRFVPENA